MRPIWAEKEECGFAEFEREFIGGGGEVILKITADYKYAAYINGVFISNGQCADLPEYKSVDEVNITPFLRMGKNRLYVIAMHTGEDFSVCRATSAFVAFEIISDGAVIASSDDKTRGRAGRHYRIGDAITPQLGYGWKYDFTDRGEEWKPCHKVLIDFHEEKRPIKRLNISEPLPAVVAAQGIFKYRSGGTDAEKIQNAWTSVLRFAEMTGKDRVKSADTLPLVFKAENKEAEGIFIIIDLKKETSGYLSLSVAVDQPCKAVLGWGEHLADLRVRTEREGRNFACGLTLAAGKNELDDYLCRMGARYLCLYMETEKAELFRLTLREAVYPFKKTEKSFGDRLLDKIYETGRRTLELCAHEHYEDCPWREQALYGMDSRNQMLFGYGAFEEYEFPRASLRLFARSLGEDGLVALCAPARMSITIPSFSAYWLIAVCENAEVDYDESFVKEMLPVAENILGIFLKRSDEKGVKLFTEPRYWNFHEWSDGLNGGDFNRTEKIADGYDCILTAIVAMAAEKLSGLEKRAGRGEKASDIKVCADRLKARLEGFYDAERGLYASYRDEKGLRGYHAYTQAAAIMAGAAVGERAKNLCGVLKEPRGRATEMTFAALQFKYDAIVLAEGDLTWCVKDICEIFGGMLFSGATSYWETANGEADFHDAGSLCHGWAAVACYVFDKYLAAQSKD